MNTYHVDQTQEIETDDGPITVVVHCNLKLHQGDLDMANTWDFEQTIKRAREQAVNLHLTITELAALLQQANKEIAKIAAQDQTNMDKLNRILDEREKGRS